MLNNILLCAIAKNENNYIREWVEWYKRLGFTKILLCDNNDVDGETFYEAIPDYIESNFVEVLNYRGKTRQQIPAYRDAYDYATAKGYKWIAYFDIDEFLVLEDKKINKFLKRECFQNYNTIYINWKTYTDSNIIQPNGYSIQQFSEYVEDEADHHKAIIRTGLPCKINSSHGYRFNSSEEDDKANEALIKLHIKPCNVLGEKCDIGVANNNYTWEVACLNHYRYKTLHEYLTNKMKRGYPTSWLNDGKNLSLKQFFTFNEVTDDKIEYASKYLNISKKDIYKSLGIIKEDIKLYYWHQRPNVGDYYGYWLAKKLGLNINNDKPGFYDLAICGSILEHNQIKNTTKIWGCGFHNSDSKTNCVNKSNYFAVRGQLTKDRLGLTDVALGDPGILISRYYKPNIKPKYMYGIVCHYLDKDTYRNLFGNSIKIIDVCTNDVEQFINELLECKFVFSSSLHGIIFSHSYGIPAIHLESINIGSKDNFKFKDYYSVLDIPYTKLAFNKETFLDDIKYYIRNKNAFKPSLNKIYELQRNLLKYNPYLNKKVRERNKKIEGTIKNTSKLDILNTTDVDLIEAEDAASYLASWMKSFK